VIDYGPVGISLLAVVSGTFIPLGSPGLVALGAGFGLPAVPLAVAAASGYTLGVLVDYFLGRLGRSVARRRLRGERLEDLTRWWDRRGWALCALFGLVPGLPLDLLAIFCGFLKMRLQVLVPVSFCCLLVQYTLFAWLGAGVGGAIG